MRKWGGKVPCHGHERIAAWEEVVRQKDEANAQREALGLASGRHYHGPGAGPGSQLHDDGWHAGNPVGRYGEVVA